MYKWKNNFIFTGIWTSGLSNKVVLFLRFGLKWLFVNPRFVSISVLFKRDFFALFFESSEFEVEVVSSGCLRFLTDEFEELAARALD